MQSRIINIKKLIQNRRGFTLVELMVVVAIIGTLASIAIPQYAKFQAKARQSEVKLGLAGMFTVENSFAADNQSFTSCLGQIGYAREGSKFYYTIGFHAIQTNTGCGPAAALTCAATGFQYSGGAWVVGGAGNMTCATGAGNEYFAANIADQGGTIAPQATIGDANKTSIGQAAFTIGGSGNILKGAANLYDQWTMDNTKQLINIKSGI